MRRQLGPAFHRRLQPVAMNGGVRKTRSLPTSRLARHWVAGAQFDIIAAGLDIRHGHGGLPTATGLPPFFQHHVPGTGSVMPQRQPSGRYAHALPQGAPPQGSATMPEGFCSRRARLTKLSEAIQPSARPQTVNKYGKGRATPGGFWRAVLVCLHRRRVPIHWPSSWPRRHRHLPSGSAGRCAPMQQTLVRAVDRLDVGLDPSSANLAFILSGVHFFLIGAHLQVNLLLSAASLSLAGSVARFSCRAGSGALPTESCKVILRRLGLGVFSAGVCGTSGLASALPGLAGLSSAGAWDGCGATAGGAAGGRLAGGVSVKDW